MRKIFLSFIAIFFLISFVSATVIFSDGFEDGVLDGWVTSGSANQWHIHLNNTASGSSNPQSFEGNYSLFANATNTIEEFAEKQISTVGYNNINFSFYAITFGLDPADWFAAYFLNGSTWFELIRIEDINQYTLYSFNLSSLSPYADNNASLRIKFGCSSLTAIEWCNVDNITIAGDLISGGDTTPPSITINSPTNSTLSISTPKLNLTIIEPNPDAVWISVDGGANITYAHRNGTIDFGSLELIFVDDFYSYQEGSDGSPVWTNPSSFGIANVTNKTYRLYNETPLDDALSYITNFNQYNYGGSAKVMVPSGSFGGAYLTPRFNDVDNKYEIALDYDWSSININRVVGGSWSTLANLWTGDLPIPIYVSKNEWHTVGFNVKNSNISAYVDGQLALSVFDSYLSYTGFSLIAFDDVNTHTSYFDDVEMHKDLSYGSHKLIVYANDSFGNVNFTTLDFFVNVTEAIDTILPSIQIIYPQNITYTSNVTELNYSVSDNVQLSSCWYSLNNGVTNTTITCGQNVTGINSNEGSNTWKVYANDTSGNENSSLITFFVNTTIQEGVQPLINISYPSYASTYLNNQSLELNFSVQGENIGSCWYNIDGSNNISISNCQNTTFSAGSNGEHTLRIYVNETLSGKIGQDSLIYFIKVNAPTIHLFSPRHLFYTNSSTINFSYIPLFGNVASCDLWGNFNGSYSLNQTNNSVIVNETNFFNLNNLSEGNYSWAIACNSSQGNYSITGNRTLVSDFIPPSINLSSPIQDTYSPGNISFNYTVNDTSPTTCTYNITLVGGGLVTFETIEACENTVVTINVLINDAGTYNLEVNAGDAAGNSNSDSSSFSVSGSGISPGGGGGGATDFSRINELTFEEISRVIANPGDSKKIAWKVRNTGINFLNECKFKGSGAFASWITTTETKDLAVGERYDFVFDLDIPEDAEAGQYLLGVAVECEEVSKRTNFIVELLPRKLAFEFIKIERTERDKVNIAYSLEELSGIEQNVDLQFLLYNSNDEKVAEAKDFKTISANSKENFNIDIPIDPFLEGELKLLVNFNSETYSGFLQENIVLGKSIGGFAIFGDIGNIDNLTSLILIILFLIFAFFVVKKILRNRKELNLRKRVKVLSHSNKDKIILIKRKRKKLRD